MRAAELENRLRQAQKLALSDARQSLADYYRILAGAPERHLEHAKASFNTYLRQLSDRQARALEAAQHRLALSAGALEGVSPVAKLRQGFSYVEDADGRCVHSVGQVRAGDLLQIRVTDGTIESRVTGTEERSVLPGGAG